MTSVLSFFWPRRTQRRYWLEKKSSRAGKDLQTCVREDFAQLGLRFPAKPYRDLAALFTRLVGREAKS